MESFFTRHKNATILAAVLALQVLGLATQIKRPTESGPVRLIRFWAISLVTPLERSFVHTEQWLRNSWRDYFYLRGVRKENAELRAQIERMRLDQLRLEQDAAQARRLQALLQFKEQYISKTVAAQVIGSSGAETSHIVYIDRGSDDGIATNMAVITPTGVVGKVLRVFAKTSQVLQITDQSSGVGATLVKTRLQGILKGQPTGNPNLAYIMSDETIEPGEEVITSGGDRIFPKGLPIGKVASVSPGKDLFLNVRVTPSANLNRLEEVLVITKIEEKQSDPTESGRIRAADILAQRLPSVPDKAAGAANAATGTQTGAKPAGTKPTPSTTPAKPSTAAPATTPAGATARPATPPVTGAGANANTAAKTGANAAAGAAAKTATPGSGANPAAKTNTPSSSGATPAAKTTTPNGNGTSGSPAATPAKRPAASPPEKPKPSDSADTP